jgi:magnesium transporter
VPPSLTAENLHDPLLPYVTTDIATLTTEQTIAEAQATLRLRTADRIGYFYVVDGQRRLVGIAGARDLLMAEPGARVADVMKTDVVAIPSWATVLVACEYFINRRLLAFPVVDEAGRLAGTVDVELFTDEMIRISRQSFDDIFQLIGIHASYDRNAWGSFLDRFPWLLCNIAGGLIAAALTNHFGWLFEIALLLAAFIPVVLALSESISIQSVTLTIQSLHSGRFNKQLFLHSVRREAATALLLGLACGGVLAAVAWGWKGDAPVAVAIGGAVSAAMVTSALFGVVLPHALHALRANPRIAAGPIVLASADTATLLFYFWLAASLVERS